MSQNIDVLKITCLKEMAVYGHTVRIEEMPLDVFLSHPEVDTQRDTEGRAARAYRSHLKVDSPLHGLVFIAELDNGERYIIDACTRRYLWEQGKKNPLDSVLSYTVKCQNLDDARRFYFHLDSGTAVDKASDVAFGLLRAQNVTASSELVRKSGYLTGLRKAFPAVAQKPLVAKASELLHLLDGLQLSRRSLPAGCLGAFFLSALRYGEEVLEFWRDVTMNIGTASESGRTPAAALARRIEVARAQNKLTGDRNVTRLMEVSLAILEVYQKDPDTLLPDDWNEGLRRESYVQDMLQAKPELEDWFLRPQRAVARKTVKATKAPKVAKAPKAVKASKEPKATKPRSARVTRTPVEDVA